jgi:hypothetical protein
MREVQVVGPGPGAEDEMMVGLVKMLASYVPHSPLPIHSHATLSMLQHFFLS